MPKHQYATVTIPGTKKVSVCSRRIGSRDRLAVIAICNNGDVAENIVDALNAQQGDIVKLETSATRQVGQLRNDVAVERKRADDYRCKLADKDSELADAKRTISELEAALTAAQSKVREDA